MSNAPPVALIIALAAVGALSPAAQAQSMPDLKFSGFGSLSAVHSNEKNADFVATVFQPSGAGASRNWSFDVDSKLGGQVSAQFNDKLSAVVQVVAQHQYDNSYTPHLEWANVKYQLTPEFSARLGRIATPSFLISDSRLVDYASPWVRPPVEVYNALPITNNDGIDASYRNQIGAANNAVQAFFGTTTAKVPAGEAKAKLNWGVADSVDVGSLTLRAGYQGGKYDLRLSSVDPLFAGLGQFAAGAGAVPLPAFQAAAAQALALTGKYQVSDISLSSVALGASYDPGDWFVMSEMVFFKGTGLLANARSWYASGGYRFGAFTPYATYATVKPHIPAEAGISTAGAPPLAPGAAALNGGINATLLGFNPGQNTTSLGLRWDAVRNVALKLQYDYIKLDANSAGHLVNFQPAFQAGSKLSVVTLAVDFVF